MNDVYIGMAIFLANVIAIVFFMMVKVNRKSSHSNDDYEDDDLTITLINQSSNGKKSDYL